MRQPAPRREKILDEVFWPKRGDMSEDRNRNTAATMDGYAKHIRRSDGRMTTARDRGCPVLGATRTIRRECREAGSRRSSRLYRRNRIELRSAFGISAKRVKPFIRFHHLIQVAAVKAAITMMLR